MNDKVREVRDWAFEQHARVNHNYDKYKYSYHLQMVADFADKYYIPAKDYDLVQMACYCHDTIEDARVSANDLVKVAGVDVAKIVYALTNNRGWTRKDRANDDYYSLIRKTRYAVFVKMCDRMANMTFSKTSGSSMYSKYVLELEDVVKDDTIEFGFISQLGADKLYPVMAKDLRAI